MPCLLSLPPSPLQAKAMGKVLFEQVCRQLNLLEADYFGLEYQEAPSGTKYWLDLEKAMNRQVGLSLIEPMLRFCVKFYTPDPLQLEEEYTRYLFCLQVKRDLATGSLQCNDNTAALMASYIVQGECFEISYKFDIVLCFEMTKTDKEKKSAQSCALLF